MKLTAFHTPDGLYYWDRLLIIAKPSSAVQQSPYLEALDNHIDYYENGSLRRCLRDEHGNRLKDAEGNLITSRHRFAIYWDDACAGANSIEELYELFEAPISCCCTRTTKIGVQVRAFLGCCQKMSQYIKGYGITAAPLHGLTKEARAFSKPWFKGED